jgi:hypothetical protein
MAVPALIDSDDCARGREIIPLLRKAIVKEHHATMQKYDRRTVAVDFCIELGAPHFVVALRATGAIRVRSHWAECSGSGDNGMCDEIHDACLGV